MNDAILLKLDKISRRYSKKARGVSDLSFEINSNQRVALLGLNGAGKSTTFKLISGLLHPEQGSIEFNGCNLMKAPNSVRKKMGYLSEDIPLCRELSVLEHLKFQVNLFGAKSEKLEQMIELCELGSVLHRPINHLSRGYRQRVALAGTFVHEPKLILLDEPTAGLDPHQVDQFRQLIKTLASDCALLLSTHVLSEVELMCERCLILHEGKLVADVNLPLQDSLLWELECESGVVQPPLPWRVQAQGLRRNWIKYQLQMEEDSRPEVILAQLIQAGVKVMRYGPKCETLESIFLEITSGKQH